MVGSYVRTIAYRKPYGSVYGPYNRYSRNRRIVNKAAQLLRNRMGGYPRAPLSTRGFYGSYSKRGRTELKYIDNDTIPAAVTSSGTVTLLNGVASGTGVNERVGRQNTNKSYFGRFGFYPSSTTNAPVGTIIRVIVFFDSQTNSAAAAPAVTDVLETTAWDSPMNLNNRERFKILLEFKVTVGATAYTAGALTAGSPVPRVVEKYRKLNMTTTFSGVGSGVSSIATGGIFLLTIANVNNTTTIDAYHRIRFTDC